MDAGVHSCDQVVLPRASVYLPGTERGEQPEQTHAEQGEQPKNEDAARARRLRIGLVAIRAQGRLFACCSVMLWDMPGIMFEFRWNMTQMEPDRVMTTSTSVKISASMFQPPSDFVSMCRK